MNQPSPAIVAQSAVRRLPRAVLLLLCAVYALFGYFGRGAWKSADMASLGVMAGLANGSAGWLHPGVAGFPAEINALLPYWLGAAAINIFQGVVAPDAAARLPFIVMLILTMLATWYGTYYLARTPRAQPVAFAFGGEARPTDYARTLADAGILALLACLGLAQLSHETTPALAQLCFASLLFFGTSAFHYRPWASGLAVVLGAFGLSASGAPVLTLFLGIGSAFIHLTDRQREENRQHSETSIRAQSLLLGTGSLVAALLMLWLKVWVQDPRWQIRAWSDAGGHLELLIWFIWPAWPLAVWTIWRWRKQLFSKNFSRHLILPIWHFLCVFVATLFTGTPDRTLLLALPALASLAAFSLPTLSRSLSALVDWFTLLFFSFCGFTIWVVWLALQTGVPPQPAINVTRLAPGFVHQFSLMSLAVAVLATIAWGWLVQWRVGRHRAALWKSLVLPASGAVLCFVLLMTLWMPLLDYSQSYAPWIKRMDAAIGKTDCVVVWQLPQSQIAALEIYGHYDLVPLNKSPDKCNVLVTEMNTPDFFMQTSVKSRWIRDSEPITHPVGHDMEVFIYRRKPR